MSTFLTELALQRMKFIEGLDANEGDINLDIFEDFYPDQAHFVFELLQNAEDAGATEAIFTLRLDGCCFEHNGTRVFTEADVRSITGIHNSTKSKTPDQIGKFGVGFKSVFVYTLTPFIRSGNFSFKISRLVLPEPIASDATIGSRTNFWLPFNNPKKSDVDAYAEIREGLEELAETTLLFLTNLKSIRWMIDDKISGEVLRVQHSENHFEVLKQSGGKTTASSHFLKFDRPVAGLEKQRIAVAFGLELLPKVQQFVPKISLAKQLKIIPQPGQVAVFFPAKKEASGLRFHLHAPFVPELSRASIKDTPANEPLFSQLAELVADSLYAIRELKLLTSEFLGVLPNGQDAIPDRYHPIRTTIIDKMNNEPLTPTYAKTYAPAKHLLQAKASLKELLSLEDIEFLVDYDEVAPQWAIGASQKHSNQDRFLSGLAILEWDIEEFVDQLEQKADEAWSSEPDVVFMNWLSGKMESWCQQMYAMLYKELGAENELFRLRDLRIVRLETGSYSRAGKCYFPSEGGGHDEILPRVAQGVYTSGKSKGQQEDAKKFLEEIGVREVGEIEQVEAILKQYYSNEDWLKKDSKFHIEGMQRLVYFQHLRRFISIMENVPSAAPLFSGHFIFEGKDGQWCKPNKVYLDTPYLNTGLESYYEVLDDETEEIALSENYLKTELSLESIESIEMGRFVDSSDKYLTINSSHKHIIIEVSPEKLANFAKSVGAITCLKVEQTNCYENPEWHNLRSVPGERYTSPINRDFVIAGLEAVLEKPTITFVRLLWSTLCEMPTRNLRACYQKNQAGGSRYSDSQLIHQLRKLAWVPLDNGEFVRPAEADRDLLPEGFVFDPGWSWVKAIKFGEEVTRRSEEHRKKLEVVKELGFRDDVAFNEGKWFANLDPEVRKRFKDETERKIQFDLPDNEPSNPERRAGRVGQQAVEAPGRNTEKRERSVSVGRDAVKQEAAEYLRQQYTNGDGEMICQVCQEPLPFKLDDGSYYFEKVEFLGELEQRHHQNYLALCPNHSAMFQHANGSRDFMKEMFSEITDNTLEVIFAQANATVYFTKTHIADLKAVIEADGAD